MRRLGVLLVLAAGVAALRPGTARAQSELWGVSLDLGSGGAYIVEDGYWNITALAAFRVWQIQMAIEAPINLDVETWSVRAQDWDEATDYQRIVRCVRGDLLWEYDRETGDRIPIRLHEAPMLGERGDCASWDRAIDDRSHYWSLRVSEITDLSLGTGHVMDGYTTNLDVDHYTLGVVGQLQGNEIIGGTAMLNDVTRPNVVGGRLYLRPLWALEENEGGGGMLNQLEIGLTWVSDFFAPTETLTAFGGARLVDEHNNLLYDTTEIAVWGFDLKWRLNIDNEWFAAADAEYGFIWDPRRDIEDQLGNMGGHAALGFFWEPPTIPVTLDFFAEYRLVGSSYIPNYFDHYYSVQREQYALTSSARSLIDPTLTKLGYLRSLAEETDPYLEHSYNALLHFDFWRPAEIEGRQRLIRFMRIYGWVDHIVGRPASGTIGLAAVFPNIFDAVTVTGMYVRRGFNDITDVFALDGSFMRFLFRWDRIWSGFYIEASYVLRWHLVPQTGFYESAHDFVANVGFDWDAL